jgi:hypothetical protein
MTAQPTPSEDEARDDAPRIRPPQPNEPTQWQPQQWQPPPVQPPPSGQIPPGWQPPGQYGYVVYQAPPYNTLAILALVLGAMVLPPLGIYFGHKAQQQIAQTGERGVELAKAGVVVGWILTALYGLFFIVWCAFAAQFFAHAPR